MPPLFKKHLFVCTAGETCPIQDSLAVCESLREEVKKRGLKKTVRVNKSGCLDQCGNGPMVVVYPDGIWYGHVQPSDASEIVEKHIVRGERVKRLLYSKAHADQSPSF